MKIAFWWEDEYYSAYKKNSGLLNFSLIDEDGQETTGDPLENPVAVIVKTSDPEKFVTLVTKSGDLLLGRYTKYKTKGI